MVAGIGCRAGVSGEQVEAAIATALAALHGRAGDAPGRAVHNSDAALAAIATPAAKAIEPGIQAAAAAGPVLTAIATPAAKASEPGIQAAAAARGLPILAISQPELEAANRGTATRSARSMAAMNVHSVAEAAALAGAGTLAQSPTDPTPRLLQPRVAVGPVTCALADTTPP